MSNLHPLNWQKGAALGMFETVHELVHYTIRPDIDDPNKYRANLGNGDHKTLNSVEEAKQWIETDYYPHKMQPYVKPMPTWIDVDKREPTEKGDYLIRDYQGRVAMGKYDKGFYMESGGEKWGCVQYWMPIPEFSTMQNLHKGGDCEKQ